MKRPPHSAPSRSITNRVEAVPESQSSSQDWTRTRHWLMRFLASAPYLAAAIAVLTGGSLIAGARGLVIAGVLIVVAIPIVGFTSNQMTLTNKGRKLATTVNEVRALKESDALAFSQPLATILRRTQISSMHTESTSLPQAIGQEIEFRPSARLETRHGDDPKTEVVYPARPRF